MTTSPSAERCKLSACRGLPVCPSTRASVQLAGMIMYLGRTSVHISLCLWVRVHACITVCPSWRREPAHGTLDRRYTPFPKKRKQRRAENDTRLLCEACERTFLSLSIPFLQVFPAGNTWILFLSFIIIHYHFYGSFNVTLVPHSQAVCSLLACADLIRTKLFLVPDRQDSPFLLSPTPPSLLLPFPIQVGLWCQTEKHSVPLLFPGLKSR